MKQNKFFIVSAAFVVFAALLRFPGLFHDFWVDEIWSLNNVSKMSSPFKVFAFFDENNHILNSLYMYFALLTSSSDWIKYRLLSYVLGVGTVASAAFAVRRMFHDAFPRVVSLLLLTVSFPLVVYSTEARGYGAALFFSVVSFCILIEYFQKRSLLLNMAFQASMVLGFLAHIEFAYIAVGLFLLYASHLVLERGRPSEILARLAKLFVPFSLIVSLVYVPFILHITFQSADPEPSVIPLPMRFFELLFGGSNKIFMIVASVAVLFVLVETYRLAREKHDLGIFTAGILVIPAGVVLKGLITWKPLFVAPRYFILLAPFFYFVFAHALNRSWFRGGWGRIIAISVLLLVAGGNLATDAHFLRVGRGKYLEALSYMYRNTDSPSVTVSSDHDFRNVTLLLFYDNYMSQQKRLVYISSRKMPGATEWYIAHSREETPKAPDSIKPDGSTVYRLEKIYPFNGQLSGFHWFVYRRAPGQPRMP